MPGSPRRPTACSAAISNVCSTRRDPRWGIPAREAIEAPTPASFRKLWEPLLASGPIEVQVFGDIKAEATIEAVGETFGALKPRTASTAPAPPDPFPAHIDKPVVRTHTGKPEPGGRG